MILDLLFLDFAFFIWRTHFNVILFVLDSLISLDRLLRLFGIFSAWSLLCWSFGTLLALGTQESIDFILSDTHLHCKSKYTSKVDSGRFCIENSFILVYERITDEQPHTLVHIDDQILRIYNKIAILIKQRLLLYTQSATLILYFNHQLLFRVIVEKLNINLAFFSVC